MPNDAKSIWSSLPADVSKRTTSPASPCGLIPRIWSHTRPYPPWYPFFRRSGSRRASALRSVLHALPIASRLIPLHAFSLCASSSLVSYTVAAPGPRPACRLRSFLDCPPVGPQLSRHLRLRHCLLQVFVGLRSRHPRVHKFPLSFTVRMPQGSSDPHLFAT